MSRLFALFLAGYGLVQPAIAGVATPCDATLPLGQIVINATAAVLVALSLVAYPLAGASVAGVFVSGHRWRALVAVGSIASMAALALVFRPIVLPAVAIDALLLGMAYRMPSALDRRALWTAGEVQR